MDNLQNSGEHSLHDPKEIKYGMIAVPKGMDSHSFNSPVYPGFFK